ncbi:MAG: nucleotidyl transferase AbiEii/AbiGii toxin family protein [Pirellulales bacterium]
MPDNLPRPDQDEDGFREALAYSASRTGFSTRLIEKDYFCSLLLDELTSAFAVGLVFKGGTALSKVHAGFYRLSEDLDFVVSIETDAVRSRRRAAIEPIKLHLERLLAASGWLSQSQSFKGANQSSHYTAVLSYSSSLSGDRERIRFEVGLREPVVETAETKPAGTILFNPFTTKAALHPIPVTVMSKRESYAEKIRAALCRRIPAIRDLYDLDYAAMNGVIDPGEDRLLQLVSQKLAVPGNAAPDVSASRLDVLRRQVDAQLRPVLRKEDFSRFDLDRAFDLLRRIQQQLH